MSSVAESEPLSLADQSVGVSEDGEGSDISVGKDECESKFCVNCIHNTQYTIHNT